MPSCFARKYGIASVTCLVLALVLVPHVYDLAAFWSFCLNLLSLHIAVSGNLAPYLAIILLSSSIDSETRIPKNSPKCGNHHLSLASGIWLPCISRLVVSNLPLVHFPCQVVLDVNHRAICPKLAFQWREQLTEIFYSIRVNFSAGGQCNWTECLGARWKSLIWKIWVRNWK